jgi:predicted acetyltransferase
MVAEVRKIDASESDAFVRACLVPFLLPDNGDEETEHLIAHEVGQLEPARAWIAESQGRFVGNSCVYSMDLTLPPAPGQECPVLPMAGVSSVGVQATHRRQGILRRMMAAMLADARERGEALAGLIASESIIYGRYGFGHATDRADFSLDSRVSEFTRAAPELDLQLVGRDEMLKLAPPIFERQRRTRAGEPSRNPGFWEEVAADPKHRRDGGTGLFFAVGDDGYVSYRAHNANTLRAERCRVVVEDLRGLTPEIEAGLWRFVLDLDLVGEVTARRRPVDEPVRWRLADPRQLLVTAVEDHLHIRVLDVKTALEGRGYRESGRLVLDLRPPLVAEESDPAVGCWVLEVGPDGAECRPAGPGAEADLRMEVTDLGSLYLGGFRPSLLAAGGRIDEISPGALARADVLFASPLAPFSGTGF